MGREILLFDPSNALKYRRNPKTTPGAFFAPSKVTMSDLSSAQRKYLRKIGHHLDPLVIIGKQGVTDMLVRAVTQALESHELVKIRFNEFKEEKRPLIEEIERRTASHVVGTIGHVALFYKENPDEDKRKIFFGVD